MIKANKQNYKHYLHIKAIYTPKLTKAKALCHFYSMQMVLERLMGFDVD